MPACPFRAKTCREQVQQTAALFDHLVGAAEERERDGEAERREFITLIINLKTAKALHSITVSAVNNSFEGIGRSSALAVWRLIANSNLVDWITGKSAGLVPLRIRPT